MEIQCPACRKANSLEASPASLECLRCGCDLEMLAVTAEAAEGRARRALGSLEERDWKGALSHAERSWSLRYSKRAAVIAFLASAAGGQTRLALRWRRRADNLGS